MLSDTRDPEVWVEEELRWQDMVRALDGQGRIFYRNRPENTSRKSGNLEDLHPLGWSLPLHDRAGCRQHHEGRNPGRNGADHGAPPARGVVADPAGADQP